MPNPNVDTLTAEFSIALERWFDRWKSALEAARNGHYPFEQLATDVADTWVDSAYVSLLPMSLLGGVTVTATPVFPVVRFNPLTRNDVTRLVSVPNLPDATSVASEHLMHANGSDKIPSGGGGNVTVSKNSATPGETYLKVSLTGLSASTPPAGFYAGNVIGQPMNAPIARIEVNLP